MNNMGCLSRLGIVAMLAIIGVRFGQKNDFSTGWYILVFVAAIGIPFLLELGAKLLLDIIKPTLHD